MKEFFTMPNKGDLHFYYENNKLQLKQIDPKTLSATPVEMNGIPEAIQSDPQELLKFLKVCYARLVQLDDGNMKLYVMPRIVGGVPPRGPLPGPGPTNTEQRVTRFFLGTGLYYVGDLMIRTGNPWCVFFGHGFQMLGGLGAASSVESGPNNQEPQPGGGLNQGPILRSGHQ